MIELHHASWSTVPGQGRLASFVRPPKDIADPTDLFGRTVLIDNGEYRVEAVETFTIGNVLPYGLPYEFPYGLVVTKLRKTDES